RVKNVVDLNPGAVGQKAADVPQSEAVSPLKSCHVQCDYKVWAIPPFEPARSGESAWVRRDNCHILEKREVKKGAGATAPGPNPKTEAGKAGVISPLPKEKSGP